MIALPLVALTALTALLAAAGVAPAAETVPTRQQQALLRAAETVPLVEQVRSEDPLRRRQRLHALGLGPADVKTSYFVLDSPLVRAESDQYLAVRFNHGQHAARSGDCSRCHHRRPEADMPYSPNPETVRCSACHQASFNPDFPERPGLRGAYHQACIPCHQQERLGPQTCNDCHRPRVPDHKELVRLPDKPDALQVTAECRRCHEAQAEAVRHSVHWRWRGPSPYTADHSNAVAHGKGSTALNNY